MIPNKAFQALACGTPLVTADTPAARELLADGESALLVPPGDPEALAAALRRLAGDADLPGGSRARRAAYREHASEAVLGAAGASCSSARCHDPCSALGGDRSLRRRLLGAVRCFAHARSRPAASTSGTWSRPSGRRRTATRSRMTDLHGEQISRLGAHVDPILAAFAPLWWCGRARHAPARRAGGRASRSARSRCSGSRASTSARSAPRSASRSPTCSTRPSSGCAGRVPRRRARLPAPPVRVLVPRRGPARAVRRLRRARRADEGRGRARGRRASASGTRSRAAGAVGLAIAAAGVAASAARDPRRHPALHRAASPTSTAATARSAARAGGIVETALTDPLHVLEVAFDARGLGYLVRLLAPVRFVALAPLTLVAALPELAMNLLSSTATQTSIHFHYTAPRSSRRSSRKRLRRRADRRGAPARTATPLAVTAASSNSRWQRDGGSDRFRIRAARTSSRRLAGHATTGLRRERSS